jgi:hypothetical protein
MSGPEARVSENVKPKGTATVQSAKSGIAPLASQIDTKPQELAKSIENHRPDFSPLASSDSPTIVGSPEGELKEDGK